MKKKLVISPNWLGDAVMALPAFEIWRKMNSGVRVSILSKKSLVSFWEMVDGIDEVLEFLPGNVGLISTARTLRGRSFDEAVILPNSFRSAFVTFLGGIPNRRGFAGQLRALLLTDRVSRRQSLEQLHQQWEDVDIFLGDLWTSDMAPLASPSILITNEARDSAVAKFGLSSNTRFVGIIPGAARGESKRWPFFADAANLVRNKFPSIVFLVFGASNESVLCETVADKIGSSAHSVAGRTSLKEFTTLLSLCDAVMCNDSGGMHLSTAVGTPVAAVFGLTDYTKTGPLGKSEIIKKDGAKVSRRISATSPEAIKTLSSIAPELVADAVISFLSTSV